MKSYDNVKFSLRKSIHVIDSRVNRWQIMTIHFSLTQVFESIFIKI